MPVSRPLASRRFVSGRRTGPPRAGLGLAAGAAAVSGVSVFVNSYAVHSFHQAAVYTTAKNIVAVLVLAAIGVVTRTGRSGPTPVPVKPPSIGRMAIRRMAGVAYVGVVGGGVAFILFFDGLARSSAVPAAFLHDSLVVWVALLALPLLGEALSWWNLVAVAFLLGGETALAGGVGHLTVTSGPALVLGATLLWAVETVVAKRLLATMRPSRLARIRMGVGIGVLVAYVTATGHLHELVALGAGQVGWVLLTGVLLGAYVAAWMGALARARAVDVTSVLVAAAVLTAFLDALAGQRGLAPQALGLSLLAAGTLAAVRAAVARAAVPGSPGVVSSGAVQ